jgi:pimeloyl-ACP methyl ester carboxylesterase
VEDGNGGGDADVARHAIGRDNGVMTTSPTDRWFDGDGIRIHALDWGGPQDGTPVLFLHGVGGNAWIWDDVAPRLRTALPDTRLVALDGREGGDTDHPATGYERERYVADVLAVHDALGGRPMVLVGHSRGGWLAAWLAATHPDRVERLVLVDPARLVFASRSAADGYYAGVRGALGPFESEEAAIAWARQADPRAQFSPVRVRSFLFGLRRLPDGRLVGKLPPEVVPQLQAAREDGDAVATALGRISCPTLLLVGTRQPDERIAHRLAYGERIPGVTIVRIDGTHFLHTDAPAEVAAAIADFVAPASG